MKDLVTLKTSIMYMIICRYHEDEDKVVIIGIREQKSLGVFFLVLPEFFPFCPKKKTVNSFFKKMMLLFS